VQRTNAPLYRAYLLKEQLRLVFRLAGELKAWLALASRSRIPSFVRLARSIRSQRPAIEAALSHGLTNARVESVNTKIRLLQRIALGYRDPEALIAMAMLDLGCPRPELAPSAPPRPRRAQGRRCSTRPLDHSTAAVSPTLPRRWRRSEGEAGHAHIEQSAATASAELPSVSSHAGTEVEIDPRMGQETRILPAQRDASSSPR